MQTIIPLRELMGRQRQSVYVRAHVEARRGQGGNACECRESASHHEASHDTAGVGHALQLCPLSKSDHKSNTTWRIQW